MCQSAKIQQDSFRLSINEDNDCSVIALTLATNISYDRVHFALANNGRRNRDGAYTHQIHSAINDLGCTVREIPLNRKYTSKTIPTLLKKGTFLVYLSDHVYCVKDGDVLDYTKGRRHAVEEVFQVIAANDTFVDYPRSTCAPVTRKPRITKTQQKYKDNLTTYGHNFGLSSNEYHISFKVSGIKYTLIGCSANVNSLTPVVATNRQNQIKRFTLRDLHLGLV